MVQSFTPSGAILYNIKRRFILEAVLYILLGWSVLFATNSDFFNTVEELKAQGHEWEYTGKKIWNNEGPAILIESHKGTKPRYYWKIGQDNQISIWRKNEETKN